MANTDNPFGFQPYGKVLRQRLYIVGTAPAINVHLNDLVVHGADSLASKWGTYSIIKDDAVIDGSTDILGGITSIFDHNMDPVNYIALGAVGAGGIAGFVMVADHPDQEFIVQEDSETNAITLTEAGQNVDMICAGNNVGNTNTGLSTQELDSDTASVNADTQIKLHYAHPDDTVASDFCRYIVTINEHHYGDNLAGL